MKMTWNEFWASGGGERIWASFTSTFAAKARQQYKNASEFLQQTLGMSSMTVACGSCALCNLEIHDEVTANVGAILKPCEHLVHKCCVAQYNLIGKCCPAAGCGKISTGHKDLLEHLEQGQASPGVEHGATHMVSSTVSWRSEGIKHKKNEIFLDVVEKLNLLVSSNGTVLHSEVLGAMQMKSFLSGMPELKLGLNDKLMYEATGKSALECDAMVSYSFHVYPYYTPAHH
jgi:hypothetical protein